MNDKERNIWVEYKEKTPPSHTVLQKEIQSVIDGRQIGRVFKIRVLNDLLRKTGIGGEIYSTQGIEKCVEDFKRRVFNAISSFDDFNNDNDPYGEHDVGIIEIDKQMVNFKIDYYDLNKKYGSEEPYNPSVTTRVMTIMLASEY